MAKLRQIIRYLLLTMFVGAVLAITYGVLGEFFIEWARENGWYEKPSARVGATMSAVREFVTQVWFLVSVAALGGLTIGVWLDYFLRRRERAQLASDDPSANEEFEFGRVESKIETLDPGKDLGEPQQYFRLWVPIRFKRKTDSVTVRVSALRPLGPLDKFAPQYVWKPIENMAYFEGDTAEILFATIARDRRHNGFYGDIGRDNFYIGGMSRHLFEIDVLIDARRTTKRIYLESLSSEIYSDMPRGPGQFGNLFVVLEEGDNIFESEWVKLSRDAVAGRIVLPIGNAPQPRGGFGLGRWLV